MSYNMAYTRCTVILYSKPMYPVLLFGLKVQASSWINTLLLLWIYGSNLIFTKPWCQSGKIWALFFQRHQAIDRSSKILSRDFLARKLQEIYRKQTRSSHLMINTAHCNHLQNIHYMNIHVHLGLGWSAFEKLSPDWHYHHGKACYGNGPEIVISWFQ